YGTTGTTTSRSTTTVTSPLSGRVVSVDSTGNTVVVETPNGRETFTTTSTTRFMSGGRTVMLSNLHEGDNVVVTFTGTGADRNVSRIEVTPSSSTARSSTTSSTTTTSPSSSTYGSSTTTTPDTDTEMPATASPLPAVLMTGLILLASGLALRRRRRA
ncbi:MAG TPA: hypothetical protein VFO11_05545, partial [Candidatus Polarisedimenticolaceae bacterium]|nr:hypothetical protein [Candidatus Polarisedimenticolaceae bacterium]